MFEYIIFFIVWVSCWIIISKFCDSFDDDAIYQVILFFLWPILFIAALVAFIIFGINELFKWIKK